MLQAVSASAEALDATLVNMRFVKPLDEALLAQLVPQHSALVTLEENVIAGGASSGVGEYLDAAGHTLPRLHIGLPDEFLGHGSREECLLEAGLDVVAVRRRIEAWWQSLQSGLKSGRAATKLVAGARVGSSELR
jgi:1-deoxy-D-xylulose-5-phosphate synthase